MLSIIFPWFVTQASQSLIPPTAAVIGSGLGTWSQARPIIIFVRDNKGKALPIQWLLQPSFLPWSNSSGKNDVRLKQGDMRNTESERESQQHIWTTFTLGLLAYTNLYIAFWPVWFGLLSLTTVTVFSDYSSCSSHTHFVCVCACTRVCVCNRSAAESHTRVVIKPICLNIRTNSGTRFRTQGE